MTQRETDFMASESVSTVVEVQLWERSSVSAQEEILSLTLRNPQKELTSLLVTGRS